MDRSEWPNQNPSMGEVMEALGPEMILGTREGGA